MLGVATEDLGARRHLEVGEVEAGGDGAAAERPRPARRDPRGLPASRFHDGHRLAAGEVRGEDALLVASVGVDQV